MDRIHERVFIVRLVTDKNDPTRVAGAAGFSVRDHKLYIYKFKCCLLAAGGAVNVFRPRSVDEGTGRAWYPVWNAGPTYAMAAECGATMTMMDNFIDDENWKCFVNSQYDRDTKKWKLWKQPYVHLIKD